MRIINYSTVLHVKKQLDIHVSLIDTTDNSAMMVRFENFRGNSAGKEI